MKAIMTKAEAIEIMISVAKLDRHNSTGFAIMQENLARLGQLAVPAHGHRCPDCSRSDALFCYSTAVQRIREMKD
jgi:hypothetical protein